MSRMNILEMVNFETIVNSFWPLTITATATLFILDAYGVLATLVLLMFAFKEIDAY